MAKWSIPLDEVVEKMESNATTVVLNTIYDSFRRVILRSPVGNPELWAANEEAGVGRSMRDLYGEVATANNEAGGRRMGTGRATLDALFPLVAGKGYVGGRFRASWTVSKGFPTTEAPPESTDVNRALSEAAEVLALGLGDVLYLVNNLPYAQRLEYGWSSQAPAGVVRLTAMEFNDFFKRNLAAME